MKAGNLLACCFSTPVAVFGALAALWLRRVVLGLFRDLQIDYTSLSLVAPEKVLLRYKLEGLVRDWQDVGTRRQAFYTHLPPRQYRFRRGLQ